MNVLISYHIFAHYRRPIIEKLQVSPDHKFLFVSDTDDFDGIKALKPEQLQAFRLARFRTFGPFGFQPALIPLALAGDFDAFIFLGNPNFVTTWIAAAVARVRGKKVLFWAHGWLCPESPLKTRIRLAFYRLAHLMLVYGERAKALGSKVGYPADRIRVIYNSLDYERALDVLQNAKQEDGLSASTYPRPQTFFADGERPIIICTARLTALCQFDLLFEAAALSRQKALEINILLVGDGPERQRLEALARGLGLSVHFYGACYDEAILARLIYHSDVTVSPGKIGLTVIHSLTYGTPAVTHGDLDHQMPEVEAIVEGKTGALFERNSAASLAATIESWLAAGHDREEVRRACQAVIADKWNPTYQSLAIHQSLAELSNTGRL